MSEAATETSWFGLTSIRETSSLVTRANSPSRRAMIWLAVRLSLAIPITVAEKRFAFFDSFKVTGGHLWGLIGMAVIAFVMTLVVSILTSIVFFPLTMGMGAAVDWESLEGMNAMGILQAIGPMVAVAIVLQAISSALLAAVMYAPFAAAYRDLKGKGTPELA